MIRLRRRVQARLGAKLTSARRVSLVWLVVLAVAATACTASNVAAPGTTTIAHGPPGTKPWATTAMPEHAGWDATPLWLNLAHPTAGVHVAANTLLFNNDDSDAIFVWHSDTDQNELLYRHPAYSTIWNVVDAAVDGDLVVAVGRVALDDGKDPRGRPAVWISRDAGKTFDLVDTSAFDTPGEATAVVIVQGRIVVLGRVDSRGPGTVVWTSTAGHEWSKRSISEVIDGGRNIQFLAQRDGDIIAFGADTTGNGIFRGPPDAVWTPASRPPPDTADTVAGLMASTDGVALWNNDRTRTRVWIEAPDGSWSSTDVDPAPLGGDAATLADIVSWRGQYFAIADLSWDVARCYQDVSFCQRSRSLVVTSTDLRQWRPTNLSADDPHTNFYDPRGESFDSLIVGDRLTALARFEWFYQLYEPGPSNSSSPASATAPLLSVPVNTLPSPVPLHPELAAGETHLEPHVPWHFTYGFSDSSFGEPANPPPCYDSLPEFNGKRWHRTESRAPLPFPSDWPVSWYTGNHGTSTTIYATIELVRPDRIEISIDGRGTQWVFDASAGDTVANPPGTTGEPDDPYKECSPDLTRPPR